MSPERLRALLDAYRIPQYALSLLSGVSTYSLSMYLRKTVELPEAQRDALCLTVEALADICENAPLPVSFREPLTLREVVSEKVAALRRARSAELRASFEAGQAAVAG